MNIAWFRDLIIIIYGLVSIGILIMLAIMAIMLFRRVVPIMDALKVTANNVQEMSTFARQQIASPLARVAALIQGIAKGIESVSNIFRHKKGG